MSLELFVEKTASKINKKSSKNWSWECPGTFPEPPGRRSGHFLRPGGDFKRIWSVSGTSRSQFGHPAGSSRDPKIAKKTIYSQKDGLGERHRKRFSLIWYADIVLDRFLSKKTTIFQEFWIRFVIAKKMSQESSIPFLHKQRTLKIIVFCW